MRRVGDALRRYAPPTVTIANDPGDADLQICHVIGGYPRSLVRTKSYAVIQYCWKTNPAREVQDWQSFWQGARLVWSYYGDLPVHGRFYHAPLGVDGDVFKGNGADRDGVVTSGFLTGPGAEAIEEVALAADHLRMKVFHLGPAAVAGAKWRPSPRWRAALGISDASLAKEYGRARWVSGLRYVEGFELPVLEGLACGARPIVFSRSDMKQWYAGHAVFVEECSGSALVEQLLPILSGPWYAVTEAEREIVLRRFDWKTIAEGFWKEILS